MGGGVNSGERRAARRRPQTGGCWRRALASQARPSAPEPAAVRRASYCLGSNETGAQVPNCAAPTGVSVSAAARCCALLYWSNRADPVSLATLCILERPQATQCLRTPPASLSPAFRLPGRTLLAPKPLQHKYLGSGPQGPAVSEGWRHPCRLSCAPSLTLA